MKTDNKVLIYLPDEQKMILNVDANLDKEQSLDLVKRYLVREKITYTSLEFLE